MPDKFFVIWTPAMYTPANTPPGGYILGDAFASWMTDTLAAGIDPIYNSRYGAFPSNVHIYDHFHNTDSLTYLPLSLAVSPTDNHLNAAATELLAPLFVNDVFDAAIQYETGTPTGMGESILKPNNYILNQNYPNPFNPSTEIDFYLADSGNITLKVYDCHGSELATLADGFRSAGKHSIKFNAKNFSSGVYLYRLETDNFTSTRKMILIK